MDIIKNIDAYNKNHLLEIRNNLDVNYCVFNNTLPVSNINNINIEHINNILSKKFINKSEMESISCLFNKIVLNYSHDSKLKDLFKYTSTISTTTTNGYIYLYKFLNNIDLVFKTPKKGINPDNLMLEYYICINVINKLRFFVPNYCYTLGYFKCSQPTNSDMTICSDDSKKSIFIVNEKIDGISLLEYIKKNIHKNNLLKDFIGIYIQLLIALHIGQIYYRLCHKDLHISNIIIKNVDIKYNVNIDNINYLIKSNNKLPIIIDFDRSTCVYNGKQLGKISSEYIPNQSIDINLLTYDIMWYFEECLTSNDKKFLKSAKKQMNIFENFFKKIYINENNMKNYSSYSPYKLLNNIYGQYRDIWNENISFQDRKTYVSSINFDYGYSNLFIKGVDELRDSIIKNIYNCEKKYNTKSEFYEYFKSHTLNNLCKINNIECKVTTKKEYEDDNIFNNVLSNFYVPSKDDFKKFFNILNLNPFNVKSPEYLIIIKKNIYNDSVKNVFNYINNVENCLQIIYTIYQYEELYKDKKIYKNFADNFLNSKIYYKYCKNIINFNMVEGWYYSLEYYIKNVENKLLPLTIRDMI